MFLVGLLEARLNQFFCRISFHNCKAVFLQIIGRQTLDLPVFGTALLSNLQSAKVVPPQTVLRIDRNIRLTVTAILDNKKTAQGSARFLNLFG